MTGGWDGLSTAEKQAQMDRVLQEAYREAEGIVQSGREEGLPPEGMEEGWVQEAKELGATKHAFRGAAVTLLAYKCCSPEQDIRAHKAEQEGGFAARSFDTEVTVPFLIGHSLPKSSETHWLTQTLSFSGALEAGAELKTQPAKAGPLLVSVVNRGQSDPSGRVARRLLVAVFVSLIEERNRSRVVLTLPKGVPIRGVLGLLQAHFGKGYQSNAPRLPQLAVYAIYRCLVLRVQRYSGQQLEGLQRMKAADRKAGTVGDVVVVKDGLPTEAVEVKSGQPITLTHVEEAIEKVQAQSVSRYYMLSTAEPPSADQAGIGRRIEEFRQQNGCEIIVNGVLPTIGYYLRLLPDTDEFLRNYADLLGGDEDTGYEHRNAWNQVCQAAG